MGNGFAVQLDLCRVKTESFAADQRYEYRYLGAGWIQQFFFKLIQLRCNGQHIAFYFLDLFIQAFDLRAGDFLGIGSDA